MKYILSFYNQVAAGPRNLTETFISVLTENKTTDNFLVILPGLDFYKKLSLGLPPRIKVIFLPYFPGFSKLIALFIYNFFIFPLIVFIKRPNAVLCFGSLAPVPFGSIRKIVLAHHPYLVDDALLEKLPPIQKIIEKIKRNIFQITARKSDLIVVEGANIREQICKKYQIPEDRVVVVKNPINQGLYSAYLENKNTKDNGINKKDFFFYPSRYALHKNHRFIFDLGKKYHNELTKSGVKFYVTVDEDLNSNAKEYINAIKNAKLDEIIINLGELPNAKLCDYYRESLGLFFPSNSETFGIPLIEAMAFKLPIIAPDLAYARDVCGEAALYYSANNIDDAFSKLIILVSDREEWGRCSRKSADQFQKYPSPKEWVKQYITLLKNG